MIVIRMLIDLFNDFGQYICIHLSVYPIYLSINLSIYQQLQWISQRFINVGRWRKNSEKILRHQRRQKMQFKVIHKTKDHKKIMQMDDDDRASGNLTN